MGITKQYMTRKAGGLDIVRNRKNHGNDRKNHGSDRKAAALGKLSVLMGLSVLTAAFGIYGSAVYAAQNNRQGGTSLAGIVSSGSVQYQHAVIDTNDLWKIDNYISEKRNAAVGVLNRLGTRFRQQSGEYTYDRNPDNGQEDIDISQINWSLLSRAAAESQGVPAGLAVLNQEAALHIEGVEEGTDFYLTATEDNLSAGKAAWVDGRLLLGNGADNDRAYRRGLEDGEKGRIPERFQPIYGMKGVSVEIRHAHVGDREDKESVSGCYRNYSVTDKEIISCDRTVEYLQPVWSPDENEPGGGTWHGGFYTCPAHGGLYDSPRICAYEKVIIRIGWHHDVICGLENMLYARLTIKEVPDPKGPVNRLTLEAVLEEAEGYNRLVWRNHDKLVWTDKQGNTLGTGCNLTVFEPGIYRCSINAANTDINCRMAEAVVTVSGLMVTGN